MHITLYSTRSYDLAFLQQANTQGHSFHAVEARLDMSTVAAAEGSRAVCVFVNDRLDAPVLQRLKALGVGLIALRCAGFNQVDLACAAELGLEVARVPEYSPYAVAEHTVALLLTLNRKIHRAHARVREGNFSLDGLLGFDLHGRTVGLVGSGKIGLCFARIMRGFGCEVLAFDPAPSLEARSADVKLVPWAELLARSDVLSLHCPLTPQTRHLINEATLAQMKPGAMLLNTSRGGVIDTPAVIQALKSGHLGSLGLDVYEEEAALFFQDQSDHAINDDTFARLLTFPNVVITGHQGFFTEDAMRAIATTTLANITQFERTGHSVHPVRLPAG